MAFSCRCGSGEQLSIPTFDTYVEVIEAPEPMIFISSSNVIARTVQDLYYGIKPFIDVHVTVSLKDDEYADEDEDVKEISVEGTSGIVIYENLYLLKVASDNIDIAILTQMHMHMLLPKTTSLMETLSILFIIES